MESFAGLLFNDCLLARKDIAGKNLLSVYLLKNHLQGYKSAILLV